MTELMSLMILSGYAKTAVGEFLIRASKRGIVSINFPTKRRSDLSIPVSSQESLQHIKMCEKGLLRFFKGRQAELSGIPIDWQQFGTFDRRIYQALRNVPPGETICYGELARRSGFPKAARAVGNALNRNPVPILIPCHRVLRKDGSLGGFSSGIGWKRKLLHLDKKQNRTFHKRSN